MQTCPVFFIGVQKLFRLEIFSWTQGAYCLLIVPCYARWWEKRSSSKVAREKMDEDLVQGCSTNCFHHGAFCRRSFTIWAFCGDFEDSSTNRLQTWIAAARLIWCDKSNVTLLATRRIHFCSIHPCSFCNADFKITFASSSRGMAKQRSSNHIFPQQLVSWRGLDNSSSGPGYFQLMGSVVRQAVSCAPSCVPSCVSAVPRAVPRIVRPWISSPQRRWCELLSSCPPRCLPGGEPMDFQPTGSVVRAVPPAVPRVASLWIFQPTEVGARDQLSPQVSPRSGEPMDFQLAKSMVRAVSPAVSPAVPPGVPRVASLWISSWPRRSVPASLLLSCPPEVSPEWRAYGFPTHGGRCRDQLSPQVSPRVASLWMLRPTEVGARDQLSPQRFPSCPPNAEPMDLPAHGGRCRDQLSPQQCPPELSQ